MNSDSEPLLSDEETDALLAAMREGGGGGSALPSAEGIDLTSSEPRLREAFHPIEQCSLEFAQLVRKLMLRHAGCPCQVRPEPVEITPYSIIKDGASPASATAVALTPDGCEVFMVAGATLASLIIDRRLGAPLRFEAKDGEGEHARTALSEVDRRVFRPFAADVFSIFGDQLAKKPDFFQIDDVVDPVHLPELPQFEPLLQFSVIIEPIGGKPDRLTISMTANALNSLGLDQKRIKSVPASSSDRQRLMRHIGGTEVSVEAILGEIQSSVRHLLSLRAGDIIRLDSIPSQPSVIRAEGIVVLRGMPVVHHGNLALEITDTGQ